MRTPIAPPTERAERAVLGGVLRGAARVADIRVGLEPAFFATRAHAELFERLLEIEQTGRCATHLAAALAHSESDRLLGALAEVGGIAYLGVLASTVDLDIQDAAAAVREAWACRELIRIGEALNDLSIEVAKAGHLRADSRKVAAVLEAHLAAALAQTAALHAPGGGR